jgi:hypothetical protein
MTYRLNGEKGVLMKNFKDILSHKPNTFMGELLRDGLISYGVSRALDDIEIIGLSVKILSRIHPIKKGGDKKKESQ